MDGFLPAGEIIHFERGFSNKECCSCGARIRDCEVWGQVTRKLEKEFLKDAALLDFFEHRRHKVRYLFNVFSTFPSWKPQWFTTNLKAYQKQLLHLYQAVQETSGCRFIVDSSKNPAYAKILAEIPQVKLYVVHLVRDSRGVAFSLSKRKQRPGVPGREE